MSNASSRQPSVFIADIVDDAINHIANNPFLLETIEQGAPENMNESIEREVDRALEEVMLDAAEEEAAGEGEDHFFSPPLFKSQDAFDLTAPTSDAAAMDPSPARIRSDIGAGGRQSRDVSMTNGNLIASQSPSPIDIKRVRTATVARTKMEKAGSTSRDDVFVQQQAVDRIDAPAPAPTSTSAASTSVPTPASVPAPAPVVPISRGRGRSRGVGRTASGRGGARGAASNAGGRISARLLALAADSPRHGTSYRVTKSQPKKTTASSIRGATIRGATRKRGRGRPKATGTSKASGSQEFEIEKILDERVQDESRQPQYLVKWRGYSAKLNTWEPRENLTNCKQAMKDFQASRDASKNAASAHRDARGAARGAVRGGIRGGIRGTARGAIRGGSRGAARMSSSRGSARGGKRGGTRGRKPRGSAF